MDGWVNGYNCGLPLLRLLESGVEDLAEGDAVADEQAAVDAQVIREGIADSKLGFLRDRSACR